jgi:SPASM domain peptide maturase of grasp-with-spasm system
MHSFHNYIISQNFRFTKGTSRSSIINLTTGELLLVPNALTAVLTKYAGEPWGAIQKDFAIEDHETLFEYFKFASENKIIRLDINSGGFTELDCTFRYNSPITNAILDIDRFDVDYLDSFLRQLMALGCKALHLRILTPTSKDELSGLLGTICTYKLNCLHVSIAALKDNNAADLIPLIDTYPIISYVEIFGSDSELEFSTYQYGTPVYCKTSIVDSVKFCGTVDPTRFAINTEHYCESLNHNTCLHKKISLDVCGNIMSCPSMNRNFGNITTTTLREAMDTLEFKKLWDIKKDDIEVCRNCEFRHVCTDCRAYLEEPGNIYSKPLKCGYNPDTCEWEDWTAINFKRRAIEFYSMHDVVNQRMGSKNIATVLN